MMHFKDHTLPDEVEVKIGEMKVRRVVTLIALVMAPILVGGGAQAQQGNTISDPQIISLLQAAMGFLKQNNYAEAADKFEQVLARDPLNKWAETNLGVALLRQGKFEQAQTVLIKCTHDHPNEAEAWVNLATSYQSTGKIAESIDCLRHFLQLAPQNPEAPRVRSMITVLQQEEKQRPQGAAAGSDMGADYLADAKQGGLMRFAKTRMPLKVYFVPSGTVPGYKAEYDEIVKQSFAAWQEAAGGLISFDYVPSNANSDISVTWTNDPSKMISSAEGGHAMVVQSNRGIARSDITMLTVSANAGNLTKEHLRHISLHEIGHALGILGHSPKAEDMMYGVILPTDSLSDLSMRDKATMVALYTGDDAQIRQPDAAHMVSQGDSSSPINRMVKLNSEGAAAMQAGNMSLALEKFEGALKLDPNNYMLKQNLGALYTNMAGMYYLKRDVANAELYSKKAVPLLELSPDKTNLKVVLTNLQKILTFEGKSDEAAKVGARLAGIK